MKIISLLNKGKGDECLAASVSYAFAWHTLTASHCEPQTTISVIKIFLFKNKNSTLVIEFLQYIGKIIFNFLANFIAVMPNNDRGSCPFAKYGIQRKIYW